MLMLFYGGADVKHRDLIRILKDLGFYLERQGGEHEIWSNGKISVSVPRHKEVKEFTAKRIIKEASGN
jgi:mRNA interferase HicA